MGNTVMYKRYKEFLYKFKSSEKVYTYRELKEYFFIDGSEVICCTKDFGKCKSGKYYLLIVGKNIGNIYIINDFEAYVTWFEKEYMKKNVKVPLYLTSEEISILSNSLICLIDNAYRAEKLTCETSVIKALDESAEIYQKLNQKICNSVSRME